MTISSTTGAGAVDLRQPGQLLAAIPHLLGFRPAESVLVIGHRGEHGDRIGNILRADLPSSGHLSALVARLRTPLLHDDSVGVTIVIVAQPRLRSSSPPYPELVAALTDAIAEVKLRVMHVLWVPEIRTGASWQCYDESTCSGRLPDLDSTVMAAVAAHAGLVTYSSREAMESQLSPVDSAVLTRRSALLEAAVQERSTCPESGNALQRDYAAVRAALTRSERGDPVISDESVVQLALALSVPEVRDACLASALPPGSAHARTAERLWLTMVPQTPAPARAQVATLLAYSAYVRGEGALAGMAVASARAADPDHLLAGLLAQALDHALPPRTLARLGATCDAAPLWPDAPPTRNTSPDAPG